MMHGRTRFSIDVRWTDCCGRNELDLDGGGAARLPYAGTYAGFYLYSVGKRAKVVFTGDTIFDTDLGRTDLPDGNPRDMIRSCRMSSTNGRTTYTIYPGHGGSATMKQVRQYNQNFGLPGEMRKYMKRKNKAKPRPQVPVGLRRRL